MLIAIVALLTLSIAVGTWTIMIAYWMGKLDIKDRTARVCHIVTFASALMAGNFISQLFKLIAAST